MHVPGLFSLRVGGKVGIVLVWREAAWPLFLFCRSVTPSDAGTSANPVRAAESIDCHWLVELRERLEMDLIHLGEEHHNRIRRKKEQHATEVRAASVT